MISFIVIGRNEGWKLTKCLSSIFTTFEQNSLTAYEVIYVDSKSTDDSIERANEFKGIKIFQLTGDMNAAIARNVGAQESKGEVLFFIDGDMEILVDFLPHVYSEENGLVHDFVSGNWENYYYDKENYFLNKEKYLNVDKDRFEKVTGGLFLINRTIWETIDGMNPSFKKSQDIDLGLRLSKIGLTLLRKKEIAAKHHTIAYLDKHRMWKDLFKGNEFYGRSLLYRTHLLNKYSWSRLFRNDYSVVVLILSVILSYPLGIKTFLFYTLLMLFKTVVKFPVVKWVNYFFYYLLRDLTTLFGFFLFFPSKVKHFQYNQI